MKNVVYIVLSLVFLTGFSGEKVVTYLQDRGGVMYEPNTEVPFTGVLVKKYDNGQKKKEERRKKNTTRTGRKTDFGFSGMKTETST